MNCLLLYSNHLRIRREPGLIRSPYEKLKKVSGLLSWHNRLRYNPLVHFRFIAILFCKIIKPFLFVHILYSLEFYKLISNIM